MRVGLRLKLLLAVPVMALLPWFGYQAIVKLNRFLIEAQAESLRVLAESFRPELSTLLMADRRLAQAVTPDALPEAPVVDGFVDGALEVVQLLTDSGVKLWLGQYDHRLHLVIEVRDSTRRYREPAFGRQQVPTFDRVNLVPIDRAGPVLELSTEAPGFFRAPIQSNQAGVIAEIVPAFWWEMADGYRLEWQMPAALFEATAWELRVTDERPTGTRTQAERLEVAPLNPELQQLARRLSGERRAILVEAQDGRVLAEVHAADELGQILRTDWARKGVWADETAMQIEVPLVAENGQGFQVTVRAPRTTEVRGAQPALVTLGWQMLAVLIVLITGLVVFSGRLTARITRLRRELSTYLDVRGRLAEVPGFSDLSARDEVGDLARDIALVLQDLARYTVFLERIPRTLRHELSNPMSTIQTSLELLTEEQDPEQTKRLTEAAKRGIRKLEATLAKVTEAASLEEALRDEDPHAFNVIGVVRQAIESMRLAAPALKWQLDAPDDCLWILGHELRFEQLLDKLLDNARDFTPPGQTVTVSVKDRLRHVDLWVENEGSCLAPSLSAEAFRMFSGTRNDASGEHLGLGLFVVRVIAESMGSRVSIANTAKGVRVTVQGLPAA